MILRGVRFSRSISLIVTLQAAQLGMAEDRRFAAKLGVRTRPFAHAGLGENSPFALREPQDERITIWNNVH
jgi:hypothetical protein